MTLSFEGSSRRERPCALCHTRPCNCSPELTQVRDVLKKYEVSPEQSSLMYEDRKMLENRAYDLNPERKIYGTLPFFSERDHIFRNFLSEAQYFDKYYDSTSNDQRRGRALVESILFHEMKFGEKLSEFTESVLAHYPKTNGSGKDICLFGLPGSGKSTVINVLREHMGQQAVLIDNDTARYNLFAKKVLDAERTRGIDVAEIRKNLMHNALSQPLYLLLNHVARELKQRGYLVVRSSVQPGERADMTFYIEHPDGIDPRTISEKDFPAAVEKLYARTHGRLRERDTYDWQHAETVTDFRLMKEVSVDVPPRAHSQMLKNSKEIFSRPDSHSFVTLNNEQCSDPVERKNRILRQIKKVIPL